MRRAYLAIAALAPIMIGPLPASARTIEAKLCDGGTLSIPLGKGGREMPEPCPMKGCHAGSCRKKFDLAQ